MKNIKNNLAKRYYQRAKTKYSMKNYEAAEKDFSRAIEYESNMTDAYLLRGDINYELGKTDEALKDYNKVND